MENKLMAGEFPDLGHATFKHLPTCDKFKILIVTKEERTTNDEQLKRNELIGDLIYVIRERLQKDYGEINTPEIREDLLNNLDIKSLARNIGGDPAMNSRSCIVNMCNDNKKIQLVINIQERATPKDQGNHVKLFDKIKRFFGLEDKTKN